MLDFKEDGGVGARDNWAIARHFTNLSFKLPDSMMGDVVKSAKRKTTIIIELKLGRAVANATDKSRIESTALIARQKSYYLFINNYIIYYTWKYMKT